MEGMDKVAAGGGRFDWLNQLNKGIEDLPGQAIAYAKANPRRAAAIGGTAAVGLGAAGLLAGQVAKTTPDQYDGVERKDGGVLRSKGRTVDRLTGVNHNLNAVPAYKLAQGLKDNNRLGVRSTDSHAQADTKLGIVGGAAAGLGTALAAPWALRKGSSGLRKFVNKNFENNPNSLGLAGRLPQFADEVADDVNNLAKKWQKGHIATGTALGATAGGVRGYRNGIYQDELDKKELHSGQQKLANSAANLTEAMERFASVSR